MRLAEALREGMSRLNAAGVPGAGGDARALLAHAAGVPADRLTLHLSDPLPPEAAARFAAALRARAARQPVAQIIGSRIFWGRRFRVTPDVLDPRPETELLVASALERPFARILDLGTGSGAILLSCLADRPAATGLGTDISAEALTVAADNAAALGLGARAAFRQADWYAGLSGRFDLILSNPPYIAAAEMAGLAPDVRLWEPSVALTPGGDGLGAYRAIAAGAAAHLARGGHLMVEIGPTQARAVLAILAAERLEAVAVRPDLDGRDRVVIARPASLG
jgi:release factor glutamine methyltransferase